MVEFSDIQKLSRSDFREKFGTCEKRIDLPKDAKTQIKKEAAELEGEEQVAADSLTLAHAVSIMARRSERMRKIRKDPELRMMLSKRDP